MARRKKAEREQSLWRPFPLSEWFGELLERFRGLQGQCNSGWAAGGSFGANPPVALLSHFPSRAHCRSLAACPTSVHYKRCLQRGLANPRLQHFTASSRRQRPAQSSAGSGTLVLHCPSWSTRCAAPAQTSAAGRRLSELSSVRKQNKALARAAGKNSAASSQCFATLSSTLHSAPLSTAPQAAAAAAAAPQCAACGCVPQAAPPPPPAAVPAAGGSRCHLLLHLLLHLHLLLPQLLPLLLALPRALAGAPASRAAATRKAGGAGSPAAWHSSHVGRRWCEVNI